MWTPGSMKRAMVNAVFRLRNEIPKRANPDLQQGRARATFPDLLQERARVNPDLQQERARATFDVQTLRDKLHRFSAGSFAWKRRKEIERIVFQEPEFRGLGEKKYAMTKLEEYENSIPKGLKLTELALRYGWEGDEFYQVHGIGAEVAFGPHYMLAIPTIERLGTDEQRDKWLPLCRSLKLIGSYVQTEVGHGSNLKDLQTTATYDPVTEEFLLNTPIPEGVLFWAGGLGKSANMCVLVANVVTGGQKRGLQAFVALLRDRDTHQPFTGIEVGDIGAKMGLVALDNGYVAFNNFRIPRENMLMRYAEVHRDGTFEEKGKGGRGVVLSSLLRMRNAYCGWSFQFLSQAATIATRFSAVRRQGKIDPSSGAEEGKVLDYQTQQYKLLPAITLSYATWFAKEDFAKRYNTIYDTQIAHGNFQNLAELHIESCGLKAFLTDLSTEGMEVCRRACGGHGYLMASGIASICADHLHTAAAGGDNSVLYLQAARRLLDSYEAARAEKALPQSLSYLRLEPGRSVIATSEGARDLDALTSAFKQRAYKTIRGAAEILQSPRLSGLSPLAAWNSHQVELINAAQAHCDLTLVDTFAQTVAEEEDESLRTVLTRLCQLHALYRIHVNSGDFIKTGALTAPQVLLAEQELYKLFPVVRRDAVALVDAFDHSDEALGSAIGSYDGNFKERLLMAAQDSPLNQVDVLPSFHEHIKPFQERELNSASDDEEQSGAGRLPDIAVSVPSPVARAG